MPRFENAEIHIRSGVARAYVSYSVIGSGPNQYAAIDRIRAVNDVGKALAWHHQTSTGGPSDVVASNGRINVPAGSLSGGDGDYFNVADVRSSMTVRVTFLFESGAVTVPFTVVRDSGR
jgi:hypothetical protein